MKKTDKFLAWFVVAVLALVAAAFAVTLTRPKATWQPEDTPEGVAFNYLFALHQAEYERAYGYLAPSIPGYPADVSDFRRDIQKYSWNFSNTGRDSVNLEIQSVDITGKTAIVEVKETYFYEGGLFDSGESTNTFDVTLSRNSDGAWKIVDSGQYWVYCWDNYKGCE